jgi:hypothetical protein
VNDALEAICGSLNILFFEPAVIKEEVEEKKNEWKIPKNI